MKSLVKNILHAHRPQESQSVVVFASPRGGSTWVTELIASQPGFWPISEPLNVRSDVAEKWLGNISHADLYDPQMEGKIQQYYDAILNGHCAELKLRPGLEYYRYRTNRIVIKENQGGLDRIPWFEDTFGLKIVHLLRHPIPVALSREVFPLLNEFANCALRSRFTAEQLDLVDMVIQSGSHIEKGVVAWCLHHMPALQDARDSWLTITYEETVLNPESVIQRIVPYLGLSNGEALKEQLNKPSGVTRKSDAETQKMLSSGEARERLVSKWESVVTLESRNRCQDIFDVFGLTLYRADSIYPNIS